MFLFVLFEVVFDVVARVVLAVVFWPVAALFGLIVDRDPSPKKVREERWKKVGGDYARKRGHTFSPEGVRAVIGGVALHIDPWVAQPNDQIRVQTVAALPPGRALPTGTWTPADLDDSFPFPRGARAELEAIGASLTLTSDDAALHVTLKRPTFEDLDHACAALAAIVTIAPTDGPFR